MRRLRLISLSLTLLASSALAEGSRLISLDQRGALLGWEAVGRVAIGAQGYCTGVLITPDTVLTAAHCVYDARTGVEHSAYKLTFQAGWRDGVAIAERTVAAFVAHPGYSPQAATTPEGLRHDAALLKLSEPIPAATAAPFALFGRAEAGQSVSVVSYGRGRDSALSWQRECGLLGRQSGIMAFDCDVTFGSSGAPVFARVGGRARILTLVSQGGMRNGQHISFGMELPDVVATLKAEPRKAKPSTDAAPGVRRLSTRSGRSNTSAKFVKVPG